MDIACRQQELQISPEHGIAGLVYADDVVPFAANYDEMQIMFNNVSTTAARIGLRTNVN